MSDAYSATPAERRNTQSGGWYCVVKVDSLPAEPCVEGSCYSA